MAQHCRLYLISPPEIEDIGAFEQNLDAALSGGDVACFQLRLKSRDGSAAPDREILDAARRLKEILKTHDVPLLINDRPDLAKEAAADGVHLGQSDASCRQARELLGSDASIGVTCHNSIDLGFRAGEDGADYVAFGAFFPTETKVASIRAEPEILTQWASATIVPSVAIGGITPDNCGILVKAGADFLAVSSAVWRAKGGPKSAVEEFMNAIAAEQDR